MDSWEYKAESFDSSKRLTFIEFLNHLGRDGWELVTSKDENCATASGSGWVTITITTVVLKRKYTSVISPAFVDASGDSHAG